MKQHLIVNLGNESQWGKFQEQCSSRNHQTLWWNRLSWGPLRRGFPLLQRRGLLKLQKSPINSSSAWSQHQPFTEVKSQPHLSVQRRLCESGLIKKSLLKDVLGRWTSRPVEVLSLIWWVQICVRQGSWMISEHMVPTVKHKEGALRMCEWRGFFSDPSSLKQM